VKVAFICADPGIPVFGRKGAAPHLQAVSRALPRQGIAGLLEVNAPVSEEVPYAPV
jgi:hypothetical protein